LRRRALSATKPNPKTMKRRESMARRAQAIATPALALGVASLGLKIANTFLLLTIAIALARFLGPSNYGTYAFAYAVIALLATPAKCGIPSLVVRETSRAKSEGAPEKMLGLWLWGAMVVTVATAALTVAVMVTVLAPWGSTDAEFRSTLLLGLPLLPGLVFLAMVSACLRGNGNALAGQIGDEIVRPAIFLLCILYAAGLAGFAGSAGGAIAMHAVAVWSALILISPALAKNCYRNFRRCRRPDFHSKAWAVSLLPLACLTSVHMINKHADVIVLGFYEASAEVGVYKVAAQGAILAAFASTSLEMAFGARVARLSVGENRRQLETLVRHMGLGMIATALPVALALAVFGDVLIETVLGPEYRAAYPALVIISAGYAVAAVFGPVITVSKMSGNEKSASVIVVGLALANVALNMCLIPLLGSIGAALATAATTVSWSGLLWYNSKERLGVDSAIFRL